jgi:two-component system, NtrC family, nitrogen regulation sensor histidine kinase NtrY
MLKKYKKQGLLLGASVLCFFLAYVLSTQRGNDCSNTAHSFQNTFQNKEARAKKELMLLSAKTKTVGYKQLFSEQPEYYAQLLEKEGLVFLIFEKDGLIFWSDNTVMVDSHFTKNNFAGKITKLPNGWYGIEKIAVGTKQFIALLLIKHDYAYQNNYLVNEFQKDFRIDPTVQVIDKKTDSMLVASSNQLTADIHEKKGGYLCTLLFQNQQDIPSEIVVGSFLLYLTGAALFLLLLQGVADLLIRTIGRIASVGLFVAIVIILRYITLLNHLPAIVYTTKFFSPEWYGDAAFIWLHSLGDLFINALLTLYLIFYAYTRITTFCLYRKAKPLQTFLILLSLFLLSAVINYVFEGLIKNSNIPFTLNDFFSLNRYSYVAISIIGIFFIAYFLLIDKTIEILFSCNPPSKQLTLASLLAMGVFVLISHLIGTVDLLLIFWCLFLAGIITWLKSTQTPYSFSVIVLLVFIYSFFSVHMLYKYSETKENDSRKIIAERLLAEQDPLAEHLFAEAQKLIAKDTALFDLLSSNEKKNLFASHSLAEKNKQFKNKLLSNYFGGYWDKYDIKVTLYDTLCMPFVPTAYPMYYFDELIKAKGVATGSHHLFYLNNPAEKISYLAQIPIRLNRHAMHLYMELEAKTISEEVGFPELLLDRKVGLINELQDYAYAKYKNNQLTSYHGKYNFSYTADEFLQNDTNRLYPNFHFSSLGGYSHLVYKANKESLMVVSKKEDGWMAFVTSFSYLFSYFSILLLGCWLIYFAAVKHPLSLASFRVKMQAVLVSIILFTLLFFGAGTIYYIQQQYEKQIQENVRYQLLSARVNGTQAMGDEKQLISTKTDYYSFMLGRMATIFLTDISLYDLQGNLMGSSQMKLFNEGLVSKKIAADAYYHLSIKNNVEFIHSEKIGRLEYLSAYCSFRNNEGKPIGFLNIPYFARQTELKKEISAILSALINVYLFLFVISILLALILSDYFTKPLKLIQGKLSKMTLGSPNEPIVWQAEDEIGGLVKEYNRMINELQKSADLLAQSERETAWREMAKQVAHEIKNPLTPMKLSIQHLQNTWHNQADDRDKKIQRISQTLIEQIDALAHIANEFSHFAKMPTGVYEKVDVKQIIENTIELFKESSLTPISFHSDAAQAPVYADKEQLLRVFTNLLKNAIQAIPAKQAGAIEVSIHKKEQDWLLSVRDNGTGINKEAQQKIFTPNFTTKTGGMGLGLAMVKSMVETFGGKIWFETTLTKGSIFYVSLPEYNS